MGGDGLGVVAVDNGASEFVSGVGFGHWEWWCGLGYSVGERCPMNFHEEKEEILEKIEDVDEGVGIAGGTDGV